MTRRELLDYHIAERDRFKAALEPRESHFGYVSPKQDEEMDASNRAKLAFHEEAITWLVEGERVEAA